MMVKNLRLLSSGIKKHLPFILLLTLANVNAQDREVERITAIPGWEAVAMDAGGHIYVATRDADILKIGDQGREILRYSGGVRSSTTILDAQQELRIFVFQEPAQRVFFLDQFLQEYGQTDLSILEAGYVALAAPSSSNGLWIFSNEDQSLLKIDLRSRQQLAVTDLGLLIREYAQVPIHLREYQNRVYLLFDQGLMAELDNMGNLIRTLTLPPGALPDYDQNDLIFTDQDQIIIRSLDQEQEKRIRLPEDLNPELIFRKEGRYYLITARAIYRVDE